jgi:AhpD family alkylhydroperoxidase
MKRLIEDVKVRQPRIPLPELTAEDRERLGGSAESYESILRMKYTPWVESRRGPRTAGSRSGTREQDPAMTLDYAFKVQLFWIVSRVNNCQYCIGHQESKLLGAGLSEDEIAALDGDWSEHTPGEQAAFAFARKLSNAPYAIEDADIDALRPHFTPLQILEMVVSISGNNVSNRWKEAIAVPQRSDEGGFSRGEDASRPRGTYLTPTSARFQSVISKVAPVLFDRNSGEPTRATASQRTTLESRADVEEGLEACRTRTPRLPLAEAAAAQSVFGETAPAQPVPGWMRLLANFPKEGLSRGTFILGAENHGELTPLQKAQLSWVIARHDRAWYALGEARQRLHALGQSDEQIFALDDDPQRFSPSDQALFTMAQKLAASPVVLTDADVARAVALAGPRDVVQAMHYVTMRCFFDRLTEAAGLPLD